MQTTHVINLSLEDSSNALPSIPEKLEDAVRELAYHYESDSINNKRLELEKLAEASNEVIKELFIYIDCYLFKEQSLGFKISIAAPINNIPRTRKVRVFSRYYCPTQAPLDIRQHGSAIYEYLITESQKEDDRHREAKKEYQKRLRHQVRKFLDNDRCVLENFDTDGTVHTIETGAIKTKDGVQVDEALRDIREFLDDEKLYTQAADEAAERLSLISKEEEALKEWATDNGSEFLKLKIKFKQHWLTMAREEYATSQLAGFKSAQNLGLTDDIELITDATLEELVALNDISEQHPGIELNLIRNLDSHKKYVEALIDINGVAAKVYCEFATN